MKKHYLDSPTNVNTRFGQRGLCLQSYMTTNFLYYYQMKLNCPIFLTSIASLFTMVLLCNCGSSEPKLGHDANETVHSDEGKTNPDDLTSLIDKAEFGVSQDLESFLNEGDSPTQTKSSAVMDSDLHSNESVDEGRSNDVINPTDDHLVSKGVSNASALSLEAYEAEKALSNLEESTISHQRSIDELRRINSRKDRTIASLTKLNKDLVAEVNRLKGDKDDVAVVMVPNSADSSNPKLLGLKSEIKNLRGNLLIKSEEIQDLRLRNDSLEERITQLETNPPGKFSNLKYPSGVGVQIPKNPARSSPSSQDSDLVDAVIKEAPLFINRCSLQFDAVVTALNGKNKEAFYTEFFVVNEDIEEVLRKTAFKPGGMKLEEFSGIDSFSELWARSRKNSFLFPNVQKKIRSLLLKLVEGGQGYRVRTDINGAASLENLPVGKFFVVGTASLGRIGVTWSVPIQLKDGKNKLSLTLANAAWSE